MTAAAKKLSKYQEVIRDDYSIMINSNNGVSSQVISDILDISGIAKKFLAENVFDLSVKTLTRYQSDNKKLSPRVGETALKFINLLNKGVEIFGEIVSFRNWLNKPAYGLGNKIPLDLLNTNTGIDLIEEELIRIEYGALA